MTGESGVSSTAKPDVGALGAQVAGVAGSTAIAARNEAAASVPTPSTGEPATSPSSGTWWSTGILVVVVVACILASYKLDVLMDPFSSEICNLKDVACLGNESLYDRLHRYAVQSGSGVYGLVLLARMLVVIAAATAGLELLLRGLKGAGVPAATLEDMRVEFNKIRKEKESRGSKGGKAGGWRLNFSIVGSFLRQVVVTPPLFVSSSALLATMFLAGRAVTQVPEPRIEDLQRDVTSISERMGHVHSTLLMAKPDGSGYAPAEPNKLSSTVDNIKTNVDELVGRTSDAKPLDLGWVKDEFESVKKMIRALQPSTQPVLELPPQVRKQLDELTFTVNAIDERTKKEFALQRKVLTEIDDKASRVEKNLGTMKSDRSQTVAQGISRLLDNEEIKASSMFSVFNLDDRRDALGTNVLPPEGLRPTKSKASSVDQGGQLK